MIPSSHLSTKPGQVHSSGVLRCAEGSRRRTQARDRPPLFWGRQIGGSGETGVVQAPISFPSPPGWMFTARPYRRALAFLGSGFGRLLDQSRQIGTAAACDPAKRNRVAPRGDCVRRWRCCCSAIRLHRRDEGVNHFSAAHFLTRHSRSDCGGEGTPRLSPLLWSAMGLPGMVFGSAVHLSQFQRSSVATAVP
jgi:hypothetical protein